MEHCTIYIFYAGKYYCRSIILSLIVAVLMNMELFVMVLSEYSFVLLLRIYTGRTIHKIHRAHVWKFCRGTPQCS